MQIFSVAVMYNRFFMVANCWTISIDVHHFSLHPSLLFGYKKNLSSRINNRSLRLCLTLDCVDQYNITDEQINHSVTVSLSVYDNLSLCVETIIIRYMRRLTDRPEDSRIELLRTCRKRFPARESFVGMQCIYLNNDHGKSTFVKHRSLSLRNTE